MNKKNVVSAGRILAVSYRALSKDGWAVDGRDYTTAFRVKPTPGKSFDELQVTCPPLPWSDARLHWRQRTRKYALVPLVPLC